ncbi:hypothetical protein PFZ55_39895 [Streptomyces sp. MS2A]|nr:hypothetical protein [Streptomyces sp. MS2A]
MDTGQAALLGAAIGGGATFLASLVGPLVRDAVERRRSAARERRREIREAFAVYQEAARDYMTANAKDSVPDDLAYARVAISLAAERISLLLTRKEDGIMKVLHAAAAPAPRDLSAVYVQASTNTVRAWYRGEIRPTAAEDNFRAEANRARDELSEILGRKV